jgi:uncharacterized membrane protein YdfJ with MMPL/SSD domain
VTPARDDLRVEPSLGELVGTATRDLSELMRKEVQLAKAELREEVATAAKGAGLLGGAGGAALLGLLFLDVSLAYAIGLLVPLGAAFAILGALHLVVAAVLALTGKGRLGRLGPPRRTIATVKDDVAWAKHPTRAP